MGNNNYSRRKFLKSLTPAPQVTLDAPFGDGDDPLFQKYSRKKLTPRTYSTQLSKINVGNEDSDTQRVGDPVTSGLQPYAGQWTEQEVLHLVRRTNFGWKKSIVDLLLASGSASAAVDAVLNVSPAPPAPPVNWYDNIAGYADESRTPRNNDEDSDPTAVPPIVPGNPIVNPKINYGADWTNHFFPTNIPNYTPTTAINPSGQTTNHNRMDGLRRWLFGLTLNGDHTIREKMVWFWYHFIPIDFETIYQSSNSHVFNNCARLFYRYMKLFRDNAVGNYKNLIRAICVEPAMMYYLNNQANTKTAPDENFARELMELFTLGKDDPANTFDGQLDVIAAAKVLTGWRVENLNTANVATNFKSNNHDYTTKTFSNFFKVNPGDPTPTISSVSPNGHTELDALLTMIFNKSTVVSQYICRRLYRYFVYYDIDANVEANVIVPLAQVFVANNWNIKPVLATLFKSQHFYDMANRGCYIKTPFDLVAGTLNCFNVNTADANIEWQYRIWSKYNDGYSTSMEQQMGSIPNVSGWNAFYQTPAYHQYWINSNAIQKRFVFIRDIFNGHTVNSVSAVVNGVTTNRVFKVDPVAFALNFGSGTVAQPSNPTDPSNPNKLTAACVRWLLCIDLSQEQRDNLKATTLLSGQSTDDYWTTAWLNYQINPSSANRSIIEPRLRNLLSGICQLAEYQLM